MSDKTSTLQNLIIIGFLVFLFNQVYYPVFTTTQTVESPRTIADHVDILVTAETPTNVLSGTFADVKIIMNNPSKGKIVIKDIEYFYGDYDTPILYKSNIIHELELYDSYEANLHMPIPEIYQLYRGSETEVTISCTIAIRYEEHGEDQWIYTSYNMYVFDKFLDTENTERSFNNEPTAIT